MADRSRKDTLSVGIAGSGDEEEYDFEGETMVTRMSIKLTQKLR